MKTETLRDSHGARIAEIEHHVGKQVLRNRDGRRLGEYIERDNVTRDASGSRVGTGNLLLTLLHP